MDQNNYNNLQNPNVESSNMVQPNMQDVNQINSMLQYNVPTPQQPVPQYVSNEPQNLSITPKKNNKKVLFIVLGGLLIVVAVVVTILLLNKDSKKEQNKEETNVADGNVELVINTNDKYTFFGGDDYHFAFLSKQDNDAYVVDCDGNKVFNSPHDTFIFPVGDGYFFDNYYFDIYSNNELVLKVDNSTKLPFSYKDNVFYYETVVDGKKFVTALDANKKEVLWKTEGHSPSILTNDIIVAMYGDEEKIQLLSKDGKIIVQEKDNEKIHITSTDIYFKVINDSKVEIYDFNNKLLSTMTLASNETFDNSLSAGLFITKNKLSNDKFEYKIYDRNLNVIKTFDFEYHLLSYPYPKRDNYVTDGLITKSFDDETKSVILSNVDQGDEIYVFADGYTIHYPYFTINNIGYISSGRNYVEDFSFMVFSGEDNMSELTSLDNKKNIKISKELSVKEESPNGNYVILDDYDYNYYIYDSNLELVYELNSVRVSVYDDKHIIGVKDGEIFLINVFDGTKTKLNVNGQYVDNNSCGIVTKDGEKYNLYKVN